MSSFLSDGQKRGIDQEISRLHDTFSFAIFAYIETPPSPSEDISHNALYSANFSQNKASYKTVLAKHEIQARVKYMQSQTEELMSNRIPDSQGRVRIKVSPEDYEKVKISTKIQIRDSFFVVDADYAVEGMFSNNFYTVYLKREN